MCEVMQLRLCLTNWVTTVIGICHGLMYIMTIGNTHVICIRSRSRYCCVSWLPLVPVMIGELLDGRVMVPLSVCVGAAGDVDVCELVAKVCKINAIFAASEAFKNSRLNTASSILSSLSMAVSILPSISWNRSAFDCNCFERSARRTVSVGASFKLGLDSWTWDSLTIISSVLLSSLVKCPLWPHHEQFGFLRSIQCFSSQHQKYGGAW